MSSPLPDLDWEPTAGFFAAAARGELAIPRCAACGAFVWYPRPACPGCGGTDQPWTAVSGEGSLFSWALVERALFRPFREKAPYVTGLVAIAEDPTVRIVTTLLDCDPAALRVDQPVRVVFRPLSFEGVTGAVTLPFFTPIPGGTPRATSSTTRRASTPRSPTAG